MRFGRPDLLWLALASVPVVVLHLVRRRRRRLLVPSLLLWERVLASAPRRFGPPIFAALLSLLLVLLAIGGVTIASADPFTGAPRPAARPLLVLVGASARMGGERWDRAVAHAVTEIERKADMDPLTLVLVSDEPRILAARETNADRGLRLLRQASPGLHGDGWPLVRSAILGALERGSRVVAVGVHPEVPDPVAVHPVGGGNVGITAFECRVEEGSVEVFLRVVAPGGEVVGTMAGRKVFQRPVEPEMRLSFPRGHGGLLRIEVTPPSGPRFDDAVEAWIAAPAPLRIAVVGHGGPDPFLRAAIGVLGPFVDQERSGVVPRDRIEEASRSFDALILLGGKVPEALPDGNWILLTEPPESLGLTALPPADASPVWRRALEHPVTRGVDAAEVQVLGAAPARLPDGVEALLAVPGGAVAAAGSRGGVRFVWIGLDPENSTLPVTGAFPLLLRNALRWFASLSEALLPPSFALGEKIAPAARIPAWIQAVSLTGPGPGDRTVVEVVAGSFSHRPSSRAEGEVLLGVERREHRTHVNALLPVETTADPLRGEPAFAADRSGLRDTRRGLWPWFAGAAALFLLLEWLLHRFTRG